MRPPSGTHPSRPNPLRMLIVNADDWGRSPEETEAVRACHARGAVTSVSAMVFMRDSERAAELARVEGVDVGLHLNLTERFTAPGVPEARQHDLQCVSRFLRRHRYAVMFYHPGLRRQFHDLYRAQADEFIRLYGAPPVHVDGHQHMHLCWNVLLDGLIPRDCKVRRNFSFDPGEKSLGNRLYRRCVDAVLRRRYRLTDYFYSLEDALRRNRLAPVLDRARSANVELMTHPAKAPERDQLLSPEWERLVHGVPRGTYTQL